MHTQSLTKKIKEEGAISYMFLAAFFGLFYRYSVDFIGTLFISELIALTTLGFLAITRTIRFETRVVVFLQLLLSLVLVQLAIDLLLGGLTVESLKVIANYLVTGFVSVFIYILLLKSPKNLPVLLIAVTISTIMFHDAATVETIDLNYLLEINTNWVKERYTYTLYYGLALFIYTIDHSNKTSRPILIVCFFVISMFMFYLDARSLGLICFAFAMLQVYSKIYLTKSNLSKLALTCLIILVGMIAIGELYIQLADSGVLTGHNSYYQVVDLGAGTVFELLIMGRSSVFSMIEEGLASPLIGFGSYGKAHPVGFWPAHSILVGAFFYSGILGFVIMLALLLQVARWIRSALISAGAPYDKSRRTLLFLAVAFLWSIFFSPINALRVEMPLIVGLTLVILRSSSTQRLNSSQLQKQ